MCGLSRTADLIDASVAILARRHPSPPPTLDHLRPGERVGLLGDHRIDLRHRRLVLRSAQPMATRSGGEPQSPVAFLVAPRHRPRRRRAIPRAQRRLDRQRTASPGPRLPEPGCPVRCCHRAVITVTGPPKAIPNSVISHNHGTDQQITMKLRRAGQSHSLVMKSRILIVVIVTLIVRFNVAQEQLFNSDGTINQSYLNLIDDLVRETNHLGMVATITLQEEYYKGPAFPTSTATRSWKFMAQSYRNDPDVFFDLITSRGYLLRTCKLDQVSGTYGRMVAMLTSRLETMAPPTNLFIMLACRAFFDRCKYRIRRRAKPEERFNAAISTSCLRSIGKELANSAGGIPRLRRVKVLRS